jgi:RNA-directed DNA polymerase
LPVNSGTPLPTRPAREAEARVLGIQTKLHRWAVEDPKRRFPDLYNLVCDPAFLLVAWRRVRTNKGARTAGVDGETAAYVEKVRGEEAFLAGLRADLKAHSFRPLPVRERMIEKKSGGHRRLGIPALRDRVVQASLKLVLEPILEADFSPSSYGYRPNRQAQDAIAEVQYLTSRSYEWVVEGDIKACFDEISHSALLGRLRNRIGDRAVLALVKAFLKSGILTQDGGFKDTITGTPQGGILSPLMANLALCVLDEHLAGAWARNSSTATDRSTRRRRGLPNSRLVRFADDFVVLISGTEAHAEAAREEAAAVLATMGLRLSEQKTRITHVDEGFDFLGFRIQRHKKRGSWKRYVYTYPSKASIEAVKDKVRRRIREVGIHQSLTDLLRRLNPLLRGWANWFRHGVSKATFAYLQALAWKGVVRWLRRKHSKLNWKQLRRRHLNGWWPTEGSVALFKPASVPVTRYRYRGAAIPSPWAIRRTQAATA